MSEEWTGKQLSGHESYSQMTPVAMQHMMMPLRRVNKSPSSATIERHALRKLEQLGVSDRLEDLGVPPGNRLGALKASDPQ